VHFGRESNHKSTNCNLAWYYSDMAVMYDCICEVAKIKLTQERPAGNEQRTYSTSVIMHVSVDDKKHHQLLSEFSTISGMDR
jgi:hypothetical protein